MINRVGSTFNSLQGLQASRSFQAAERSGTVFRQALAQEMDTVQQAPQVQEKPALSRAEQASRILEQQLAASRGQQVAEKATEKTLPNPYQELEPMIYEVRRMAENIGFIGVTSQDVMRAYQHGHSFLADYRA